MCRASSEITNGAADKMIGVHMYALVACGAYTAYMPYLIDANEDEAVRDKHILSSV